jgi:hypothetical protein
VKLYADRFPVLLRQLLTDIVMLVWLYAWIRAGFWVHDLVRQLAVPGRKLQDAGTGIADNLGQAGSKVGRVPLVGDELTAPFTRAADAARSMADAGRDQQEFVGTLAVVLAVGLVSLPVALVLLGWLPRRVRWMRRAGVAGRVARQPSGVDLLALRALAGRPLDELAALGPDVAQGWRRGDPSTVAALAALELRDLGLAPPPGQVQQPLPGRTSGSADGT